MRRAAPLARVHGGLGKRERDAAFALAQLEAFGAGAGTPVPAVFREPGVGEQMARRYLEGLESKGVTRKARPRRGASSPARARA